LGINRLFIGQASGSFGLKQWDDISLVLKQLVCQWGCIRCAGDSQHVTINQDAKSGRMGLRQKC
jgi:hypothetical protein